MSKKEIFEKMLRQGHCTGIDCPSCPCFDFRAGCSLKRFDGLAPGESRGGFDANGIMAIRKKLAEPASVASEFGPGVEVEFSYDGLRSTGVIVGLYEGNTGPLWSIRCNCKDIRLHNDLSRTMPGNNFWNVPEGAMRRTGKPSAPIAAVEPGYEFHGPLIAPPVESKASRRERLLRGLSLK